MLPQRNRRAMRPLGVAPAAQQRAECILFRRFHGQNSRTGVFAGDKHGVTHGAWLTAPGGDMLDGDRQSLHVPV